MNADPPPLLYLEKAIIPAQSVTHLRLLIKLYRKMKSNEEQNGR